MTAPTLPPDLEDIFKRHMSEPETLLRASMRLLCNHLQCDRVFLQPRNPLTRVCKILRWRRNEEIPWPSIPGDLKPDCWFKEDDWECTFPLWRAALHLKPSIFIESLQEASEDGLLNIDFEHRYMFHTAFIHGHAHFPPLPLSPFNFPSLMKDQLFYLGPGEEKRLHFPVGREERRFYGSVQAAVFDGPRDWTEEERELMEKFLVRVSPVMKVVGMGAPSPDDLQKDSEN